MTYTQNIQTFNLALHPLIISYKQTSENEDYNDAINSNTKVTFFHVYYQENYTHDKKDLTTLPIN